jgi:dienelactone hydrolase
MFLRRLLSAATAVALAGGAAAGCGGQSRRLALTVTPRSASDDVPFEVRVTGLRPRQPASLLFAGRATDGVRWRGGRRARADARGEIVLDDQYLLDDMHHPGGVDEPFPQTLQVTVKARGLSASTTVHRHAVSLTSVPTTAETPARVGFYGQWLHPAGARRRTAILFFGGSEGGLGESSGGPELAATLAAHGYPVLHLAYFSEPGLPRNLERIPLEYFRRALHWLAAQPEVDPRRIVTFGISRGGELSLILASAFPRLVHAAVGYVPYYAAVPSPSDPALPAWTFHGRPVLGVIPVERSSGPVFVVGGDADALWQSGLSVQLIAERMHRHRRHDVTALAYPDAGHAIGTVVPLQLHLSPDLYGVVPSRYGMLYLGGTPAADEQAREDAWPKLLRFLAALRG